MSSADEMTPFGIEMREVMQTDTSETGTCDQAEFESVVTQRLTFRAGHAVINPHVHDFVIEVEALAPVATSGPSVGMGVDILVLREVMSTRVAAVLGHRMSVWRQEADAVLSQPCD